MTIRKFDQTPALAARQLSPRATNTFDVVKVLIPIIIACGFALTIGTMLYRCYQRGRSFHSFRTNPVPQQRIDLNPTSIPIQALDTAHITPYVPATIPNTGGNNSAFHRTPLTPGRPMSMASRNSAWGILNEPVAPARPPSAHVHNARRSSEQEEAPPAYSQQDPVVRVL